MAIDGVNGRTNYIGSAIVTLRNQLNDLTTQLASGRVSTTYAGQGTDRGFALSLRAQVASIDAFSDTATNVNTRLSVVNLALQGISDISRSVKGAAASSTIVLNNNGQTSGQICAGPLPFRRIPRTTLKKWVLGRTLPIHCAQTGMPRKGNMKPDRRMEGSRKNTVACIA